jgi:cellulose biosynthesis protein BcsQ
MAKIISFSNVKGGVGKSTLNSLLANYIAYKTTSSVALLDCDDNKSLTSIRDLDISKGHSIDDMYDFATINPLELHKNIDAISDAYDYVIIDLPGSIHQVGVISAYLSVDHFFIPVSLSDFDRAPTIDFHKFINESVIPAREQANYTKPTVYGTLMKINPQTIEAKAFFKGENPFAFEFIKSYIPVTKDLQNNVTTAEPYSKSLKLHQFNSFCEEVLSIINKNN